MKLALLFLCALAPASVRADDFFVNNVAEFNVAVGQALPGDTITLASGSWTNANLLFIGFGDPGNPITLRAQVNGRVFLTGSSRLHLAGSYLVAQGLVFTNGYPTV